MRIRALSATMLALCALAAASCGADPDEPAATTTAPSTTAVTASTTTPTSASTTAPPSSFDGLVTGIAAGITTCASTADGRAYCWGANFAGQVGDGTVTDRSTPVLVEGLDGPATAIGTGGGTTCAVTATGGAYCWGVNAYGQLGDGTTAERNTPVPVEGLDGPATTISTSGETTCAVTTSGHTYCWGRNTEGQVGDGTTTDRATPRRVEGIDGPAATVSVGHGSGCVVTTTGSAWCWGANAYGQLGDGTTTDRTAPTQVQGLDGPVTTISAFGVTTCAVATTGSAWCWGLDVADPSAVAGTPPTQVQGLDGPATTISSGVTICAVTTTGSAWCWGANAFGQIGDGTTTDRATPVQVQVQGLDGPATTIRSLEGSTCAVTSTGGVYCWGKNSAGQLGIGTVTDLEATPQRVGTA